jgi:hypothetical protein
MSTSEHLAMALEAMAKRVRLYSPLKYLDFKVRDPNGNTVGFASVIEED